VWLPTPEIIELGGAADDSIQAAPNDPSVFLIWAREGRPYLGRTSVLRRRLARLLAERSAASRFLNLREIATRVEYWRVASKLEGSLIHYAVARQHFPEDYLKLLRLRMPAYVKVVLSNQFPRTLVTTRLSGSRAAHYGPFRSRAAAEQFESQLLDLFQVRRCEDDLAPSPQHPGCVYGEMNMCLRPCQQAVSVPEYASEVERLVAFLKSDGRSLAGPISAARERLSEELNFEEAARQHKRLEKVQEILKLRDQLAQDLDRLCGVAVTPSVDRDAVELWLLIQGCWQPPRRLGFQLVEGKTVSLDQRTRELISSVEPSKPGIAERQEHLALLARWFYSSWRDGEWIAFENLAGAPYRKLVNAVHRVVGPR
jgi:hypothetical protein